MKGLQVTRTVHISASFTADQWCLIKGEGFEDRDTAADYLNAALMRFVNEEKLDALQTMRRMDGACEVCQRHGATYEDTKNFIFRVLQHIFQGVDL